MDIANPLYFLGTIWAFQEWEVNSGHCIEMTIADDLGTREGNIGLKVGNIREKKLE